MVVESGIHIIRTFICRLLILHTRRTSRTDARRIYSLNPILIMPLHSKRNAPFVAIQLIVNNACHKEINPLQLIVMSFTQFFSGKK